ncbi:heavy metal-binding domain-containing protein [Aquirufa sp. ROCK2-A2]
MKKFMLMSAIILGSFVANAQHDHAKVKQEKKAGKSDKKEAYQCPMKCEGEKTYAKKGKCPACTMDLKLVVAKK